MLQQHVEQGADATVGCLEIPSSRSRLFEIVQTTGITPVTRPMIDGLSA
jgi:ADP-glucose pyrophosphorylase